MRNIALLEWGPASLFYIHPREKIKIRTGWLEGGPEMPPFLSTMEDAKANTSDLCVRYALSAFEDLNSTIRNLRRCFGFPYQEYIGYLNTLTRTHRARREHEALVDRLRKWAIFGNVDAVVWIDYAKANQPPGSFKMGPRDSRPFSIEHMEICLHGAALGALGNEEKDEESEGGWSELEEEQAHAGPPAPPAVASNGAAATAGHAAAPAAEPAATGAVGQGASGPNGTGGNSGGATARGQRGSKIDANSTAHPLKLRIRSSGSAIVRHQPLHEQSALFSSVEDEEGAEGTSTVVRRKDNERVLLRRMIQEEVVPVHGSIYQRSIAPGPGYYGAPSAGSWIEDNGASFGHRFKGRIDEVIEKSKDMPGPGEYRAKAEMMEEKIPTGRFGKADKLVPPTERHRKLPFISAMASDCEGHGVHSPCEFHSVGPSAPENIRGWKVPPKYSFGRQRRPF